MSDDLIDDDAENMLNEAIDGAPWQAPRPLDKPVNLPEMRLDEIMPGERFRGFREFCGGLAKSLQVPVELVAGLSIAVVATAIARKVEVNPQPDWTEPIALWVLVLLPSGERKSAAFAKVLAPVYAWQEAEAQRLADEIAQHDNCIAIAERKLKAAQDEAAKAKGDKRTSTHQVAEVLAQELAELRRARRFAPSLIATDATPEAAAQLLTENHERGLIAAAEGDALSTMLGRFSDGKPALGVFLSGHAGDAIEVRRRTRDSDRLRRPSLSMALAVQEESVAEMYASRHAEGVGFLARFLAVVPKSLLGHRKLTPPPLCRDDAAWWSTMVTNLLRLAVPEVPVILDLSPEAAHELLEFRNENEMALRNPDRDRAWLSKQPGAVVRIAGVLHAMQHSVSANAATIDAGTMRAAIALGRFFEPHSHYALELAGADPVLTLAKRALGKIQRAGWTDFSHRDLFDAVRSRRTCKTSETLKPALDLLVERGWIRPVAVDAPGGRGGRPPSPRYEVNPLAQNSHNPQNPPQDHRAQVHA